MNFNKNNLNMASSPYLHQHKDNPIHWQEWTEEVLDYAKINNKVIFVSIGYSTCHWCHVMAQETFSNNKVAEYLNEHFVSIKIDREQRPDIDKKMMEFLVSKTGHGGWPLNVFLSPDSNPIFPITYLTSNNFLDLLVNIKENYKNIKIDSEDEILSSKPIDIKEEEIIGTLSDNFDSVNGGFGFYNKFPPHCPLLFMMHYFEETGNELLQEITEKTLDAIEMNGLHDHLQGGFFRYCVDREWNIPHFEKMLSDQVMLLWVYSIAYKIFKKEKYKKIVEKIIECLKETFIDNGLFISAHDADTNHKEGETYLWDHDEIEKSLNSEEFVILKENYHINFHGNFEGKNHLIKKSKEYSEELRAVEKKLLDLRKKKEQPFIDKKVITSWNALLGIAFIQAYRSFGINEYLEMAREIFFNIISKHYVNNKLSHTSIDGKVEKHEFLEDYASFLLFITYLYEETGMHKDEMLLFKKMLEKFKTKNSWIESENKDFEKVTAGFFDNPIPSSVSLAELALIRTDILLKKSYLKNENFKQSLNYDFFNISILVKKGLFHVISSERKIDWKKLPLNVIQFNDNKFIDCYKNMCSIENKYEKITDNIIVK